MPPAEFTTLVSKTGRGDAPGSARARSRTCCFWAKPGTLNVVQPASVLVTTPPRSAAGIPGAFFDRSSLTAFDQAVVAEIEGPDTPEVSRDSDDDT